MIDRFHEDSRTYFVLGYAPIRENDHSDPAFMNQNLPYNSIHLKYLFILFKLKKNKKYIYGNLFVLDFSRRIHENL